MTWFADLSPCTYFDIPGEAAPSSDRLIAVGWLSVDQPFPTGETPLPVLELLAELLEEPFQPFVFAGAHGCEFCGVSFLRPPVAGRIVRGGHANLFVPSPSGDFTYAAPSSIAHYAVDHGYLLPEPFQAAVLACPPMASGRYFVALGERGPQSEVWRDGVAWDLARRIESGAPFHEGHAGLVVGLIQEVLDRALRRSPDEVPAFDSLVKYCATILERAGRLAAPSRRLLERALDMLEDEGAVRAVRTALAALADRE